MTETGVLAPRIAVVIPCYNEATPSPPWYTISPRLPRRHLRLRQQLADERGARRGRRDRPLRNVQGKGNVVRRMFADIEADVYVLADGDGTYDAASARCMVDCCWQFARHGEWGAVATAAAAFRPGHVFGNRLLTGNVALIFGDRLKDMLSGYRVMSRRFSSRFRHWRPDSRRRRS